jgi:hypothetical protein
VGIWPATIAIKTIDGSRQECGRCFHLAAQTVTVTLNGKTYTGTIANNGKWSVNVGAADLAVLTDGQSYAVTASAVDTLLLTIAVCGLKPAHANSR